MPDITWTVGNSEDVPVSKKHPYVEYQSTNDKMTKSQKEWVNIWNSMVKHLRDHGQMEDK